MRWWSRLRWAQATVDNPVAFFYLFRFITWVLAVIIYLTRSAPEVNLRYGAGLALYALFQLSLGSLYTTVLRPRIARSPNGLVLLRPPRDLLAAGVADMLSSLVVVYFSGGWGSPFWHFAVTSIMVPCFLVPFRWAMLLTTAYVGMYMATVVLGGEGLDGSWRNDQQHIFIGFIFTAYLVGIAVSYLGHVFRALDAERLRTRAALDDLETIFGVARSVMHASADLEQLLQQVTQTVGERRQYSALAIYLYGPGDKALRLASSTAGVEELEGGPVVQPGQGLVGRAFSEGSTQLAGDGGAGAWRAAVPLRSGETLLGVLLVAASGQDADRAKAISLAETLANQIAVGVQNAHLYRRQRELAAQEERSRIAREIHDGIAQSIYMLSLNLETCAELAQRERGALGERLQKLVPLAKQALLETRQYIYDLKPLLSGERGLVAMTENQVKEFRMVSGIPTQLSVQGEPREAPVAVAAGLYRMLQEALANTLKHAQASSVSVALEFGQGYIRLSVQDDGAGFDPSSPGQGYGLENMRQRARELGGTCEIASAPGRGTCVTITLPA